MLNDWFQSNSLRGANDLFYVLLRIIAIVLIGFVLYVIIRFVLSRNGNWVFSKKSKKLNPEDRTITENIHELDLPSLIKNYEDKKEYRSALRYQFLYLLKLMTDKNMLEWDPKRQTEIISVCLVVMLCNLIFRSFLSSSRMCGMESVLLEKMVCYFQKTISTDTTKI